MRFLIRKIANLLLFTSVFTIFSSTLANGNFVVIIDNGIGGVGTTITGDVSNSGYGGGYVWSSAEIAERNRRIAEENKKEEERVAEVARTRQMEERRYIEDVRKKAGEAAAKVEEIKLADNKIKEEAEKQSKYYNDYVKEIKTPWQTSNYRVLRDARNHQIKAMEYVQNNPNLPYMEVRKSLIGTADIMIAAADEHYVDGDNVSGDKSLEFANKCLDTVFDFIPGISLVKDAISIATGVNPITGETVTDIEKAIMVGAIFVPSCISGTAKGVISKAVKILERVVKSTVVEHRFVGAKEFLRLIRKSDEHVYSALGKPESMKPLLDNGGEVTDKVVETVGDIIEGGKASGDAVSDIISIYENAAKNAEDVLANFFNGKLIKHDPIYNPGPLHFIKQSGASTTIADTFRSSSYLANKLEHPVRLFRVYSNEKGMLTKYWSRAKPNGPYQATLDVALDPEWGNKATHWIEIEVPAGVTVYEGVASEVILNRFNPSVGLGKILGGGSQVHLGTTEIPEFWIKTPYGQGVIFDGLKINIGCN